MTLWKVEQNLGNWTFRLRFKMAKYANRMNIKRNGIKEGICISFFEIVQFMHAQSCPSLCDPMDCILPGSSVHVIFQARVLEWVATSYPRGFSWPTSRTHISCVSCTDSSPLSYLGSAFEIVHKVKFCSKYTLVQTNILWFIIYILYLQQTHL